MNVEIRLKVTATPLEIQMVKKMWIFFFFEKLAIPQKIFLLH